MLFYPTPVPGIDMPKLRQAEVRRAIKDFLDTGHYLGPPDGFLASYVLNHCEKSGVAYSMSHKPGESYTIYRVQTGL